MRFIGFLALAGVAIVGAVTPAPAHATTPEQLQLAQATQTLPADIQSQIMAAINSGNADTLSNTISALIAANPSLANEIATFAVTQDPNAAATIAVAAAKAVQAQGGDPTQVTLAIIGALEAQVQPTAGPGGGGGLSDTEVANLVSQVITGVEGAVTLNPSQLAELRGNGGTNQFSQYSPPVVNLPQASPH